MFFRLSVFTCLFFFFFFPCCLFLMMSLFKSLQSCWIVVRESSYQCPCVSWVALSQTPGNIWLCYQLLPWQKWRERQLGLSAPGRCTSKDIWDWGVGEKPTRTLPLMCFGESPKHLDWTFTPLHNCWSPKEKRIVSGDGAKRVLVEVGSWFSSIAF